jgi:hypothetical protein
MRETTTLLGEPATPPGLEETTWSSTASREIAPLMNKAVGLLDGKKITALLGGGGVVKSTML